MVIEKNREKIDGARETKTETETEKSHKVENIVFVRIVF